MKYLLILSILGFFSSLSGQSGPNKSYKLVTNEMTWIEAQSYAQSQNGYLLEINSKEEQVYIKDFLDDHLDTLSSSEYDSFFNNTRAQDGGGSAYIWLGGSDSVEEGQWLWSNSSEQFWSGNYSGYPVNGAFNMWGYTEKQNEPDNFYDSQDTLALALEMWPNGTRGSGYELGDDYHWNDISASNELYFIIEKDLGDSQVETPYPAPASIADMQFEYYIGNGPTTSVPYQQFYGSDGLADHGFSNSILARYVYTYNGGIILFTDFKLEIRLNFTGASSGTFESWDYDDPENRTLVSSGTFEIVTPSLVEETDWQRTDSFYEPLSSDYWQVFKEDIDSLVSDDGKLSFIYGGLSSRDDFYRNTYIHYARTLPMNEDWQVELDDLYAAADLPEFDILINIASASYPLECELSLQSYGYGRQFGVNIYGSLSASAYASISSGGDMRIVHVASSRDLIFEYQPNELSEWTELARLNLTTGAFQGQNSSGDNFTGGLTSENDRMTLEIEAFASVATQVGDLEIGEIVIRDYTESDLDEWNDAATAWHSDAAVLADNWRYNDWLGYFNIGTDPWIYHMQHGWLYVFPSVTDTESVYFWDNSMQSVLWTSQAVYPSMYRFSDSTWIWYMKDSSNPRWFNKLGTTNWEEQ